MFECLEHAYLKFFSNFIFETNSQKKINVNLVGYSEGGAYAIFS